MTLERVKVGLLVIIVVLLAYQTLNPREIKGIVDIGYGNSMDVNVSGIDSRVYPLPVEVQNWP